MIGNVRGKGLLHVLFSEDANNMFEAKKKKNKKVLGLLERAWKNWINLKKTNLWDVYWTGITERIRQQKIIDAQSINTTKKVNQ